MKKIDLILIVLVFIFGIIPSINAFIPNWYDKLNNIYTLKSGFQIVDLIFLFMLFLIVYRTVNKQYKRLKKIDLVLPLLIFFLWMLFEIVRNLREYGISAPGEFRFEYLILVLPVYIGLNFNNSIERKKLFIFLIFISFFVPMLYIPVIGFMKGWSFGGEANRFLNSQIYLGMVYGLTAIIISKKYNFIKIPYSIISIFSVPFLFFFFIDSHRSAWLAALVILLMLLYLKEIRIRKAILLIPVIAVISIIVISLLNDAGINFIKYFSSRADAFINPKADSTSDWRLMMWQAQFAKFLKAPLLGEGFGGYWDVIFSNGATVFISPHNFYIQTLVKIGFIGLAIYIVIAAKIFNRLRNYISSAPQNKELPIIIIGFCALIAMHIYFLVYSIEYYSLMYIGLALAVVLDKNNYIINEPDNLHNNPGAQPKRVYNKLSHRFR